MSNRKSIIKNTIQVGGSTLLSRFFGVLREILTVQFMGAGIYSDAFFTAFKIPSMLRKAFAEGAISVAFIPTYIKVLKKEGKQYANSLMSLAFVMSQSLVLIICALAMWKAETVVWLIASGFAPDQIERTAHYLRILMPFIFFISSSALLAGGLQAVGHFFVPAFAPVLLNIVLIIGLSICLFFGLSIESFCFFVLLGGIVQFLAHLIAYWKVGLRFGPSSSDAWYHVNSVMGKFFMCLLAMNEINLFINTGFASYLPAGSISLIYYANRLMGIPQGVFVAALSTILLPHFSRISTYAPKRLSFYLLESAKLVFWVTIPVALIMGYFSSQIFMIFGKMSAAQVQQAGQILTIFLAGLFFFALNKIVSSIYYALHVTWIPSIIALFGSIVNVGLNFFFMRTYGAQGLALTLVIAAIIQSILLVFVLRKVFSFQIYVLPFLDFLKRYCIQLLVVCGSMIMVYAGISRLIYYLLPASVSHILLNTIGYWVWVGPLCLVTGLLIYVTRSWFKVSLYFLD
ncbi:MAG: murein biosynthesis integral membrane protein MurJ [Candidatus Dependentiae bacterium]